MRPGDADASIGLADVSYPRVGSATPLSIRGALAPIGEVVEEQLPAEVRADLARLRISGRDDVGRPVLGLPTYGAAWRADPEAASWGADLNRDPRRRGVAGVGMRVGVEAQEDLVEEALAHAGSLEAAAESIRDLALGLTAAGGLWRRRLPADPGRRLWLLGPALARVATPDGTVDELATADDRSLPRGWFSTAARRVLRPRTPRLSLAGPAAADPSSLQAAANRPPPRTPLVDAGMPDPARLGAPQFEQRRLAVARGATPPSARTLVASFGALDPSRFPRLATGLGPLRKRTKILADQGAAVPWVRMTELLTAIGDGEDDPRFDERTARPLLRALTDQFDRHVDDPRIVAGLLEDLGAQSASDPPSQPVEVAMLAGQLVAAFDPTGSAAPARRRVLERVEGLDPARPLAPPEPCLGLDLPMWRHLAATAPDWLLPGVGQVGEDVVIGVSTNQAFVDAFLIGLNSRLLEELRWRNVRVASGCTPLRTFWQRADRTDGARVDDILGVQHWNDDTGLGAAQHQPPGLGGSDLVLVFRSRLFARYPKTLLYLISAERNGVPAFTEPPSDLATRTLPSFQGRVGADVTFFGFDGMPPEQVKSLWIALEEPPAGVTFRNDVPAASTTGDGAAFADVTLADPLRVLVRGDRLVPGGAS